MKIEFPGLVKEKLPSGRYRLRVRVAGNPRKRVRLHIDPDHKDFCEHYHAARRGLEIKPDAAPADNTLRGSVAWLTYKHLDDLARRVEHGLASPKTLKKRTGLLRRLREHCGDYSMDMPTSAIVQLRDQLSGTPATADSMVEAISVMYRWAVQQGLCDTNPAVGIGRVDKGKGGAVPWTVSDLEKFRQTHPPGTTAHLFLTILMFTACRIDDARTFGRHNETEIGGVRAFGWQPQKRGSAYVEIPMLPPFYNATRAVKIVGPTYLLTDYGKSYATADALGQRMRKWCQAAGLENRSSHGVRKAAGHLLARHGCTQYQIMCIHGHTQAKTSEIYTKGIERWNLAADAMHKLEALDW